MSKKGSAEPYRVTDDLAVLSDVDLLALVLQAHTESAQELAEHLLEKIGGIGNLSRLTIGELVGQGIDLDAARIVVAALELSKRSLYSSYADKVQISCASDVALLLMDMATLKQEQIRLILLDSNQRVMDTPTVYMGTVNASVIRISELFRDAILQNSPAIIIAHNHPSGDPNPSPEDLDFTRTVVAAGELLDIQVLDHIIVGAGQWKSIRDLGLVFSE